MPACTGHTVRTSITATETNNLNVLFAFYCVPEHGNRIYSLSFNEQPNFFCCFDCFGMHNRPNIGTIPTTYKRAASTKYESWQNSFWSNISNKTLLCNKINPALPSPAILCLYLFKQRPPMFRDCARRSC